jgi:hypothetical protein
MTKSKNTIQIAISTSTHDMLEQIKKIFVSYTNEDIENFTDDKIINILANWFLGSEDVDGEWCCDDHTTEHCNPKDECCHGNCKC